MKITEARGERHVDMITSYAMFTYEVRYLSVDMGVKGWGQPILI
jgi:hypothetical protein